MTTNKNYREFLDSGQIKTLSKDDLTALLNNIDGIRGNHVEEARALIILLYYSGARPSEALNMYQGDIYKDGNYCVCSIPTLKRGVRRNIYLNFKKKHIQELYNFCWNQFPKIRLFRNYYSDYKRTRVRIVKGVEKVFEYHEHSDKLRWHFYRWAKETLSGINPYYLRHNRMTKLAENDVSVYNLKYFKGSKSIKSVEPYLHVSSAIAKKVAKHND
jgi:integrase